MPRVGDVFQLLSGTLAVPNTTIQSGPYNAQQQDWVTEANSPRPISAGGTGSTTAASARTGLGAIGVGDLSGADTKAAVVETDSVVIIDSEDDNTNKRWLVSDITAYMRTISPPTGLNRNRLVNGAFQITQEIATGSTVTGNGNYPADQWKINHTGLTTGIVQAVHQVQPSGQPYGLHLQVTADQATVSTGYWLLTQAVEGLRTSDFNWGFDVGKPAVLRLRIQVNTAGTYGFFIRNNPATHTYAGTFTISSEEVGSAVEKAIPIPVPVVGTWAADNTAGITVGFTMAAPAANLRATSGWYAGASIYGVTGQLNAINTLNAEITFFSVGLYLDPDSTGVAPKWEMPDEAEELAACQRYWFRGVSGNSAGYRTMHAALAICDAGSIAFPVTMRVAPAAATLTAPIMANCSSPVPTPGGTNDAGIRVSVTAAGSYRAYSGEYSFNARV